MSVFASVVLAMENRTTALVPMQFAVGLTDICDAEMDRNAIQAVCACVRSLAFGQLRKTTWHCTDSDEGGAGIGAADADGVGAAVDAAGVGGAVEGEAVVDGGVVVGAGVGAGVAA